MWYDKNIDMILTDDTISNGKPTEWSISQFWIIYVVKPEEKTKQNIEVWFVLKYWLRDLSHKYANFIFWKFVT